MAIHEIRVTPIEGDPIGHEAQQEAERTLGLDSIEAIRTARVYRVQGVSEEEAARNAANTIFSNIVTYAKET